MPFLPLLSWAFSLFLFSRRIPAAEICPISGTNSQHPILPAGIIEKHGPHLPLSTDMILAREISSRAAELEYALVFPEFYFGQIYEAKHQPGTMAYSSELVWMMLEETCE